MNGTALAFSVINKVFTEEVKKMAKGDKDKYTEKQKRMAKHIEDEYEEKGYSNRR